MDSKKNRELWVLKLFEVFESHKNFEPKHKSEWEGSINTFGRDKDVVFKRIGYFHYEVKLKAQVQLWYDYITGTKKRFWFGFQFNTTDERNYFIKKASQNKPANVVFNISNPSFDDSTAENLLYVKEDWKNDYSYFGIYANDGNEEKAIKKISQLIKNKVFAHEYYIANRRYGIEESDEHKYLKNWVFENYQKIGIKSIILSKSTIEYPYKYTGDQVDILFQLNSTDYALIEIELENAMSGFHQLNKYRALLAAEKGYEVNDHKRIRAILVAWKISSGVKKMCDKYQIETYIKKI